MAGLLPLVAESGRPRHYTHHLHYCTSLCTCLARMASTLPKGLLKTSLEDFFDTIFYALGERQQILTNFPHVQESDFFVFQHKILFDK